MFRARIWRSTPFRLALISAALFIAAFTIASLLAFRSVRLDLAEKLDRSIADTYAVMVATYAPEDIEDLVGTVKAHVIADGGGDQVFLLTGPGGKPLAGNISPKPLPPGWVTISASDLGLPGKDPYRTFTGEFGDYRLLVGMSEADVDEISEIALTSFASAAVVVLALAVAGGAALALRVQRRMQAIATTMSRVSEGELDARIPLTGNGDDIDTVSMQINAALERLAALFDGMRQVSVDIAHDLKTPLNRLKLVIEEAAECRQRGEDITTQLADAKAESDQINATFDALLRIAQVESGARKSRFAPVNVARVAGEIAEIFSGVAEDGGMSLKASINGPVTDILGDRELLVQLFSNLVENAIRHTRPGTNIVVAVQNVENCVVATVSDNGPGIPVGEREKVLRRMYRLEGSRTSPGSGLGLSLVKAVAELHGAALELGDNRPGLCVILKFPSLSR
jgi:signal transduction histidine kinase